MPEKMIKVSRYRTGEYTVNYNTNNRTMTYKWAGCQPNKIDTKEIPSYVVDWLTMNTKAFVNGNLVIEEDENSEEYLKNIDDTENYKDNIHTREEIEKILTGNFNKMKSELNKITNQSEKDFVISIAQEIKIDSTSKREFLAEWTGISVEMLFANSEEE